MGIYSVKNALFSVTFVICLVILTSFTGGELNLRAAAAPARPQLMKGRLNLDQQSEDGQTFYVEGYHDSLKLTEESAAAFPVLEKAMEAYRSKEEENARKESTKYMNMKKEDSGNAYDKDSPFCIQNQTYVRRADGKVVSFICNSYTYTGGNHGVTTVSSMNFDVKTGKEINLDNIVQDKKGLVDALKTELTEKYGEATFFEDLSETLLNVINGQDDQKLTWVLDPQGVTFCFGNYDIAPYAAGCLYATLTYASYGNLFTDDYWPAKGTGYGIEPPYGEQIDLDLNGDGKIEHIFVSREFDEEENDVIKGFKILVNDKEVASTESGEDYWFYSMDESYFVAADGKVYLYLWGSGDNDYPTMIAYELTGGKAVCVDTQDYSRAYYISDEDDYFSWSAVMTDPDCMPLTTRFDILSTYGGNKFYQIGEKGKVESPDPYYMIDGRIQLKSKAELTVDKVDEEGNITAKNVEIPSGSTFDLYRTDGNKIVDAKLKDGSLVRLVVESANTYPPMIDGVNAEDLFEQLFYAG